MSAPKPQAQHFDFYKYLRIMWRRKWLLVIPLVICLPGGIWLAILYPTEYESRGILELTSNAPIGQRRRTGNIRTAQSTVRTKMLSWNSVRDVILSQKVDFGREVDPDNRRQIEYYYHEIARRTRVGGLGTQHLEVTHRSTSPEKNANLVNELIKQFVGESRREAQDKARIDVKYYNDKLAVARTALNDIMGRIREFNQAHPWLGESVSDLHRQYETAQDEELRIRKRISQVEEVLEEQKKALENEDKDLLVEVAVPPSQEYVAAEQALKRAEMIFGNADKQYTPAHRRYQQAKAMYVEALAAFEKVKAEGQGRKTEELQENPKYKMLVKRIAETEDQLETLNEQRLNQNKRVSELYVKVRRAPELLVTRRAHGEEAAALKSTVQEYAKGARAADRELQRLLTEAYSSEFRVIEYARDDRTPVKSTKVKIIALGVFLGIMIGVALMALVEYLDQTFKTIDDARVALGIPALGVVPAIFTPRDHRRRLWFRVLAVSSAVFVVGVGVAIYLMVPATQDYLAMGWSEFKTWMERW